MLGQPKDSLEFIYYGVAPDNLNLMIGIRDYLESQPFPRDDYLRLETQMRKRTKRLSPELAHYFADRLIERLAFSWKHRRNVAFFFETSPTGHAIKAARQRLDDLNLIADTIARDVVEEVLQERMTYESKSLYVKKFRALQRGKVNRSRQSLAEKVASRDGSVCRRCEATKSLRLDHIHPIVLGGLSELENLQFLCAKCNSEKGAAERAILNPDPLGPYPRNRADAVRLVGEAIIYAQEIIRVIPDASPREIAEGRRILTSLRENSTTILDSVLVCNAPPKSRHPRAIKRNVESIKNDNEEFARLIARSEEMLEGINSRIASL